MIDYQAVQVPIQAVAAQVETIDDTTQAHRPRPVPAQRPAFPADPAPACDPAASPANGAAPARSPAALKPFVAVKGLPYDPTTNLVKSMRGLANGQFAVGLSKHAQALRIYDPSDNTWRPPITLPSAS